MPAPAARRWALCTHDAWRASQYDFTNPADILAISDNDSFLPDLIKTRAFQRLKDIRFLGGIDYCLVPSPNGSPAATRYTRYQHSLGVLRLAHLYCSDRNLGLTERRLICSSALLHDIGHPPLSHSLEPIFKERFDIEHHQATADIICGRVPFGKEVFGTLHRHGVNVEEVVAVVSGENPDFDGFFNGPINFDTIEGVLRSYMYIGRQSIIPSPEAVTRGAMNRKDRKDQNTVDEFWRCKNNVYKWIVNSRKGILSDFACQISMRRYIDTIRLEDDYFGTESDIFRKLSGLRDLLECQSFEDDVMQQVDRPISYQARRYYIDQGGDFFTRQDHRRYRQERRFQTLVHDFGADETADGIQRDLFHDDL